MVQDFFEAMPQSAAHQALKFFCFHSLPQAVDPMETLSASSDLRNVFRPRKDARA